MVPRILRLHPATYEKLTRLRKEAEQDGAYRVAKRIQAVLLNSRGRSSGEVTTILQAPRSKVSEWLANYEAHGVEGLLEGFRSGRPCLLTVPQLVELHDIVESGPVAYGFDSGVWTSPMIARVIHEEFGVTYHPGHVRKVLHFIGLSVQRPRRVLVRADPAEQDRWHRRTFPNLKKSPKGRPRAHLHRRGELPPRLHAPRHVEPDRVPTGSPRDRTAQEREDLRSGRIIRRKVPLQPRRRLQRGHVPLVPKGVHAPVQEARRDIGPRQRFLPQAAGGVGMVQPQPRMVGGTSTSAILAPVQPS